MKLLDKVAEAYYGGMGDRFARKTRERIHWICSKVQGSQVLDVGCSQGITEILLARESKQVIGIDIEDELIAYAKNAITSESESVKRNVEYRTCSILEFEADHLFETIILAEVMEHFSSSVPLLEKVSELLKEDGTVIITVPFGINDFIDHKKTYYAFNLAAEVEPYFEITEVEFFGKWIGLVARKKVNRQDGSALVSRELVQRLEDSFYTVERVLVDDLDTSTNQVKKANAKLTESQTVINQLRAENEQLKRTNGDQRVESERIELVEGRREIEKYQQRIAELEQTIGANDIELLNDQTIRDQLEAANLKLTQTNQELKTLNSEVMAHCNKLEQDNANLLEAQREMEKYSQRIGELAQTVESKNQEILKRLDSEENTLKVYRDLMIEYHQVEARYANVFKKYDLLSKAKLGRLTLYYWKFRKRIPVDF